MSRFWPDGLRVRVTADELAAPRRIHWQETTHHVERIVSRWRVARWWPRRMLREYFTVRTTHGLLLELYRDVSGDGQWYVQRVYD